MAEIAKWGDAVFKVNANQVLSFSKMRHSYSTRWTSHNIIGQKPKMEFQGSDMDEVSIEIVLDAELGVNPRNILKYFQSEAEKGSVHYFYVGGQKVTDEKLYIASGTENWNKIWSGGELVKASASLTFGEYR